MADTNQLLEILQADVTAVLKAVPALALANVISDNEGDIEAKVTKALATFTGTEGKNGLAIVVLLPEVTEGEGNLPGPPLTVKIEVRVLENVLLNRAAATGTLLRSSQAALSVLSALQLRHMGSCGLYAEKDPVTPVDVKKGHVSHAVTVFANFLGFVMPKTLGVASDITTQGGAASLNLVISGTGLTDIDGELIYAGEHNGFLHWTTTGESFDTLYGLIPFTTVYNFEGAWYLERMMPGMPPSYQALVVSNDTSPIGLTFEAGPVNAYTDPIPTVSAVPPEPTVEMLELSCATPGADIYFTTDGSYPAPGNSEAELYTDVLPATAGTYRAAAYASGLSPGDATRFTISDD